MKRCNNKKISILFLLCISNCLLSSDQFSTPQQLPRYQSKSNSLRSSPEYHIENNFTTNQNSYSFIKIDDFLQEDIKKKNNNLEKAYKTNINKAQSKMVEDLDDACESYIWDQTRQRLSGQRLNPIMLSNNIIDQTTGLRMLHMLSASGAVHTILLLLQNKSIDTNVLTKNRRRALDYAIANNRTLSAHVLHMHSVPILPLKEDQKILANYQTKPSARTSICCCFCTNEKALKEIEMVPQSEK